MVKRSLIVLIIAIACIAMSSKISALQSANYRVDEGVIGTGNMIQSRSENFQARDGINDLAIGESGSSSYQLIAGSKTTPDPWLSFIVKFSGVYFGVFSPTNNTTATASFSVLNYTSYVYVVQITGESLKGNGHTIAPMEITGPSQTGIEQFGINLVTNTVDSNAVGAEISPLSNTINYRGQAFSEYNAHDSFRFVSGETVANSGNAVLGGTDAQIYTVTYIANVPGSLPAGNYVTTLTYICTPTF